VSLALSPLALVEDPRLRGTAQAGKGRLVEDPLEALVATTHPFVVTHPLARVTGRRDKTCLSSEPVSTLEGADVAYGHQKLGPEDRPHACQASENPSLGPGEKTLPYLLIDALNALLKAEETSLASSATIREATSCAGRVTL
jgi:hypothetical protein